MHVSKLKTSSYLINALGHTLSGCVKTASQLSNIPKPYCSFRLQEPLQSELHLPQRVQPLKPHTFYSSEPRFAINWTLDGDVWPSSGGSQTVDRDLFLGGSWTGAVNGAAKHSGMLLGSCKAFWGTAWLLQLTKWAAAVKKMGEHSCRIYTVASLGVHVKHLQCTPKQHIVFPSTVALSQKR